MLAIQQDELTFFWGNSKRTTGRFVLRQKRPDLSSWSFLVQIPFSLFCPNFVGIVHFKVLVTLWATVETMLEASEDRNLNQQRSRRNRTNWKYDAVAARYIECGA